MAVRIRNPANRRLKTMDSISQFVLGAAVGGAKLHVDRVVSESLQAQGSAVREIWARISQGPDYRMRFD